MAEPTLIGASPSEFDVTGTTETTGSLSWISGDFVAVLGMTEDDSRTLTTPGGLTNLTLSAVASTPTSAGSSCKGYAWTGTATGTGTGTFQTTKADGTLAGIVAFVYRGSDGLGATAISAALGSTPNQNLVRGSNNSAVVTILGDWNAVADTTVTWTPSGQTQQEAMNDPIRASMFCANWGDQGAAGTTAYGFTAASYSGTGDFTAIALEIKGTAAAGAAMPVELQRGISTIRPQYQVLGMTFSGNIPAPVSGVPAGNQIFILP